MQLVLTGKIRIKREALGGQSFCTGARGARILPHPCTIAVLSSIDKIILAVLAYPKRLDSTILGLLQCDTAVIGVQHLIDNRYSFPRGQPELNI